MLLKSEAYESCIGYFADSLNINDILSTTTSID